MTAKLAVRPARSADAPAMLRLIKALAAYERAEEKVEATERSLRATLFGREAVAHAHVATIGGEVVGLAVWFLTFSTWTGRPGLYLEDLIVDEAARGRGVGRALLRALARKAQARGFARLDWQVLDWNEPAKDFYRAIGAKRSEEWEPWRVDGEALARLAECTLNPVRTEPVEVPSFSPREEGRAVLRQAQHKRR